MTGGVAGRKCRVYCSAAPIASVFSVTTNPGSTLKIRIPRSPSSTCRSGATREKAAFDIVCDIPHPPSPMRAGGSVYATAEIMLMIVPPPCSNICGSTAG